MPVDIQTTGARVNGVMRLRVQLDACEKGWAADTSEPESVPEGWRPIVTAPMDGTEILLTRWTQESGYGHIDLGAWEFIETSDFDGMRVFDWKSNFGYIEEPTHWMPAPDMPCATGERS